MTTLAIVYFSGYGHTRQIAEAAASQTGAQLVEIDNDGNLTEAQWTTLNQAHAIVFGAPTYMGNAPWQFKKFADATSKIWATRAGKTKSSAVLPIARA
ncbi:flavodoxin domain-containing protein [Snodgrassella sp. CFCC 13594]|uniref:flavodoxin family protein n=1 Tax=Snodgrassella sp. CFCC 13594 TaxID=1775559 RepID=UPI000A3EC40F|nr:flavodoxin domain-containing protein [Snodgrassella sp. CFCC 13594]